MFGDYIDVYDISRAVTDCATVPIYYESRLARIELDENEKPKIDYLPKPSLSKFRAVFFRLHLKEGVGPRLAFREV